MENHAERLQVLGELAGGVAHDFNNLLTVIIGYGEMLVDGLPPTGPLRDGVGTMLDAAHRAAELTRQLLLFSRYQEPEPKVVDASAAVRSLEKMLRRLLPEHVRIECVTPTPLRVLVDPGHLDQMIVNLAVNARDAMPSGGRLRIAVESSTAESTPGAFAVISVTDSGVGMDAATRARIFEPFFTTKPAGKGTGLGLATVFGIVQKAGGHVTVDSEPGRGSTFRVCLPLVDADERRADETAAPMTPASGTILLAEDDRIVRSVMVRALRGAGYRVLAARSGAVAAAVAAAYRLPIDLVVSDLVMPDISGPALVEPIRVARPSVRCLYVTAHVDPQLLAAIGVPADARVLQKPFKPKTLVAAVRELLE